MLKAIIQAAANIVSAIIAKIPISKKQSRKADRSVVVNQRQKGNNNTQIGIQHNTTIKFGKTPVTGGTIIIDGGNADGGGKIEYKPKE